MKVATERLLGLRRVDDSLAEDSIEVHSMFSDHFQSIFAPYTLSDGVLVARDACCRVVPCKVSTSDMDKLD